MRAMAWTAACTLILILGIGIFSGQYSRFVSEEMQGQAKNLEEKVKNDAWKEAAQMAEDMEKTWQKRSNILSMWVNHGDVDDVSAGFKQLKVSIAQFDRFHSLLYAAEIQEALSHVYHRDAFMLKNIF